MSRPWFDRLWVTQEIQLANHRATVQCGNDEISWLRLRRAASCIFNKKEMPYEFHDRAFKMERLMRYSHNMDFYSILVRSATSLCADPRDKIYGLLGLASQRVAGAIHPQYALPVETVYRESILLLLDQTQRLDALQYGNWNADQEQQIPSWIPDWSRLADRVSVSNRALPLLPSGISCARARYVPPNILEVAGIHCSTINVVHDPIWNEAVQIADVMQRWEPENLQTASYVTGESLLDAFASAIACDRLRDRYPTVGSYSTLQEWKEYISKASEMLSGEQKSNIPLQHLRGQAFINTAEGYFGLSTPNAKPGMTD
jgi:hypothetical protein